MDHKSLSQSVLGKIKEEHIKPKPHWHFVLKNVVFWAVFALSVFWGARAMGVVIFVLSDSRPELIFQSNGPVLSPLLAIIPLFWLVLFILTILIAVLGLHHTKKGYKLSLSRIVAINLLATVILGATAFALGDGEAFEKQISKHVPLVTAPEVRRQRVWQDPVEGRIAGHIEKIIDATHFTFEDLKDKTWTVDATNARSFTTNYTAEMPLRILGSVTGETTFIATRIEPWNLLPPPPRRMMNNLGLPPQDALPQPTPQDSPQAGQDPLRMGEPPQGGDQQMMPGQNPPPPIGPGAGPQQGGAQQPGAPMMGRPPPMDGTPPPR